MTRAEKHLLERAVQWWFSKRPLAFSFLEHAENPTVNTNGDAEKALAKAVQRYFRSRDTESEGAQRRLRAALDALGTEGPKLCEDGARGEDRCTLPSGHTGLHRAGRVK